MRATPTGGLVRSADDLQPFIDRATSSVLDPGPAADLTVDIAGERAGGQP